MEDKDFLGCFDDMQIGHHRDAEGYKGAWYDKEYGPGPIIGGILEFFALPEYFVEVPEKNGDLYFTAETYFYNTVSTSCYALTDTPLVSITIHH